MLLEREKVMEFICGYDARTAPLRHTQGRRAASHELSPLHPPAQVSAQQLRA